MKLDRICLVVITLIAGIVIGHGVETGLSKNCSSPMLEKTFHQVMVRGDSLPKSENNNSFTDVAKD